MCPPGLALTLRHTHAHVRLMKGRGRVVSRGPQALVPEVMRPLREEAGAVTRPETVIRGFLRF